MEPTTGIEPVNLILTKDALYQLSYVGLRVSEKNKCAGLRRILVRMQGASASAY